MKFKIKSRHKLNLDKTLYTQGDTFIERLPSGILDAYQTPGLIAIPDRPEWMVCDCCLAHVDRLWIWSHRGFGLPSIGGVPRHEFIAGYWSFCVYCRPLFESRELSTLAARVATLNSDLYAPGVAILYTVLADCVYGDVLTWEAGQPRVKVGG
jgi:hypothetical protein